MAIFENQITTSALNLPLFIARRYMLRQKGRFSSFIIKLAIAATGISVATMLLAVAVVTGFKYEVREKLFSFWGHIQIEPYSVTGSVLTPEPIRMDKLLEGQVSTTPHVQQMLPFAVRPAILNAHQTTEGIQLKGVDKKYNLPANVEVKGKYINYADSDYAKEIMLSATTANRMLLNVGDDLHVYFLEPGATMPRIRKLKVSGIYHTGMEEIDKSYALCDLRLLQRINNWQPDEISGYQIVIDNEQLADTLANQLFHSYVKPPLTTYTMMDIFPNIFSWLDMQDVSTGVIITIMAVVAIINLAVALLILIVEQVRMIGVLKAQGMAHSAIQKIFLYHTGVIAGAGILAGNILALGIYILQKKTGFIKLTEATYAMKYVPLRLYWWHVAVIDVATLLLCILCMWLPSLYIRRIQPARVLQFK
jgi:lipoprotein-releasing system permease protein